ncbi:MAG: class I SAM-dependent methyltransferase [Bryobacteraceae bacterium]|jgi:demethylmenaquinone methyltransferase/2-methoxy-6-polyprenyl-1,4-benzoquinol methylase
MREAERIYYDRRAPEYDDWYLGTGLFAARVRPGWHEEVEALRTCLRAFSMRSVLDVACGTGFLTQHVAGCVAGLDQSVAMLRIARGRVPGGRVLQGDALRLPFRADAFGCLMACHFYGHLDEDARARFLAEARRVAERLFIVDAAWREDVQPEEVQERVLLDGSRHAVYKRYFTPARLAAEIGGARVVHSGRWFVAVMA